MSAKHGKRCRIYVNGRGLRGGKHRHSLQDELMTLTRCHSYIKSMKSGNLSVAEPTN